MKFAIIAAIFGIALNQQLTFTHKQPLNNINTNKPSLISPPSIQHPPKEIQISPPPPPQLPPTPISQNNKPIPQKSKSVPPPRILNQINPQFSPVSFYPNFPFNQYGNQKPSSFDDRRFNSLDKNIFSMTPNFGKNMRKNQRYDDSDSDSDSDSNIFDRRDFRQMRDWRDFRNIRNIQNVETQFIRPRNFDRQEVPNNQQRKFTPDNQQRNMFEPIQFDFRRNNGQQLRFNPIPNIDQRSNKSVFTIPVSNYLQNPQYPHQYFGNQQFNERERNFNPEFSVSTRLPWLEQPQRAGVFMSTKNPFN